MKIKVEREISEESLDNVLCCALDPGYGGAYYWCSAKRDPNNSAEKEAEYLHEVPLKGGTVLIEDKEDGGFYRLDMAVLENGLRTMSESSEPAAQRTLANIIADNTDADDGDVLIQFCVFGKTIYG